MVPDSPSPLETGTRIEVPVAVVPEGQEIVVFEVASYLKQSIPAPNQDKIGSVSFREVREPTREVAGSMELENLCGYHVVAF
jgi:hypothetical protein